MCGCMYICVCILFPRLKHFALCFFINLLLYLVNAYCQVFLFGTNTIIINSIKILQDSPHFYWAYFLYKTKAADYIKNKGDKVYLIKQ